MHSLSRLLIVALFIVTLPKFVCGFGDFGHQIVVQLAFSLLDKETQQKICNTLPPSMKCNLMFAAIWADRIKSKPQYAWTSGLHYINPDDNPPHECSQSFSSLLKQQNNIIVAIVGDLHNPLHLTGKKRGGNDTTVTFDGSKENFHYVWDSLMIERRIMDDFKGSVFEYIHYLGTKPTFFLIKGSKEQLQWVFCPRDEINLDCIHKWSVMLARLNCQSIWKFEFQDDLNNGYYEDNIQILENLLIIGSFRLAYILKNIFQHAN